MPGRTMPASRLTGYQMPWPVTRPRGGPARHQQSADEAAQRPGQDRGSRRTAGRRPATTTPKTNCEAMNQGQLTPGSTGLTISIARS